MGQAGEFLPIPQHPAYSVSRLGQVRSERSGILLSHDRQGRVTLRTGEKTLRFYVGELLEQARPAPVVLAAPAMSEEKLPEGVEELKERLRLARKANGHLIALVERFKSRLESLEGHRAPEANFED